MAQTKLTTDMNYVQRAPLDITLLDGDMNIIAKLDDEPNDVGGLTSYELKAEFDKAGNTIKTYLNETLIPELLSADATERTREQQEAARVAAEQDRAAAETERSQSEGGRTAAESSRVQAEQQRKSGETSRVQEEDRRREQEKVRSAQEQARQQAENHRNDAEERRAAETTGIVAQATQQASQAAADKEAVKEYVFGKEDGFAGAVYLSQQTQVYTQGGLLPALPGQQAPGYGVNGAKNYAEMTKAYLEGGVFQFWMEDPQNPHPTAPEEVHIPVGVRKLWVDTLAERRAAEDAAKRAEEALRQIQDLMNQP